MNAASEGGLSDFELAGSGVYAAAAGDGHNIPQVIELRGPEESPGKKWRELERWFCETDAPPSLAANSLS